MAPSWLILASFWASWPQSGPYLGLIFAPSWFILASSWVSWIYLGQRPLHFGTILAHLSLILGLLASKWPYLGLIFAPSWLILAPSWFSWIYLGQRSPRTEVRCAKRPVGKASAWKCSCALVPWLYLGPILAEAGYVTLVASESDMALGLILASVWHHVASS